MASKETIGAVAECFGEFEEFFNGMDNRVFGYADVTPEKLRILHARILLGDKLGSLVIPKNTTLKLGIACRADSDMYVTMLYSKGRMAVPATAGVGLSEDVVGIDIQKEIKKAQQDPSVSFPPMARRMSTSTQLVSLDVRDARSRTRTRKNMGLHMAS